MNKKYQIVNTWNGGKGGRVIVFISEKTGVAGENECFEWFHRHTSHSVSEAITNQGYVVEVFD